MHSDADNRATSRFATPADAALPDTVRYVRTKHGSGFKVHDQRFVDEAVTFRNLRKIRAKKRPKRLQDSAYTDSRGGARRSNSRGANRVSI
jgi:hypothetical protein